MRTKQHRPTREQEAYWRLLETEEKVLSKAARTALAEADVAAYADHLVRTCCFHPEEYEEAMNKMRIAAAEFTSRDREVLAELVRAAMAAAASIDHYDYETLAGHKVYRADLHWYYRTLFGMIDVALQEKENIELRERSITEREPIDEAEGPY